MDWDSIKRNFRFRSGRATRADKRFPTRPPTRRFEASGSPPPQTSSPPQQPASRPVPNPPKTSVGAAGPNAKAKRIGPATHDPTTRPPQLQRSQTQGGVVGLANGAAMQPKQTKGADRPHGERTTTDPALHAQSTDETDDFDLRPQPRKKKPTSLDILAESLFSGGYLDTILHDSQLFVKFTAFLNRYRPKVAPILVRYLETQKAIKAVEYANAVAESVTPLPSDEGSEKEVTAAHVDTSFQEMRQNAFELLLSEALPAFVTYNLIKVVTEIMVNEITGRSTPIMKGLVSGLSEVFCLTDPTQEDNPIIYASEEFYHMTGYSRDFVIGTNCRFLQGPKTKRHSVKRLRQAIDTGQELSEALLNYRRDGRPFMNILMIAPLHDNKGNVKYHIGAQVDASGLIEGGKGLDGFEKHLSNEQAKANSRGRSSGRESLPSQDRVNSKEAKKKALEKLGELSDMFDLEENAIVAQRSRSNSRGSRSEDEESTGSSRSRRIFAESSESGSDEEEVSEAERGAWSLSQTGSSGNLPGVYENYFLMRPSPSLKIVFTSPALKRLGNLVQSTLLSHITAPPATLKGLKESFEAGNPVTAKVLFSPQTSEYKTGRELDRSQSKKDIEEASSSKLGRTCWISATPLLGGDDEVGVWMVVLVEQRSLGSGLAPTPSNGRSQRTPSRKGSGKPQPESTPNTHSSNSTQTPNSKATRPNYIAMPERTGSQQNASLQRPYSAHRMSNENGSPQPRKSSMKPQRTQSSLDFTLGQEEQSHHKQHSQVSSHNPHQSIMASMGTANDSVHNSEPRDISTQSNRVYVQPDTDDEDEDFQLATERGVENGDSHGVAPERGEGVTGDNGSVPGAEADTITEKESNMMARADPEKTTEDGDDDQSFSSAAPEPAPEPTQRTPSASPPEPESEVVKEPAQKTAPVTQSEAKSDLLEEPAQEKAPIAESEPKFDTVEEPTHTTPPVSPPKPQSDAEDPAHKTTSVNPPEPESEGVDGPAQKTTPVAQSEPKSDALEEATHMAPPVSPPEPDPDVMEEPAEKTASESPPKPKSEASEEPVHETTSLSPPEPESGTVDEPAQKPISVSPSEPRSETVDEPTQNPTSISPPEQKPEVVEEPTQKTTPTSPSEQRSESVDDTVQKTTSISLPEPESEAVDEPTCKTTSESPPEPESEAAEEPTHQISPVSPSEPQSEAVEEPAPAALSEQALKLHDAELAAKEKEGAMDSRLGPQTLPDGHPYMLHSNKTREDRVSEPAPEPPVPAEEEPDEGEYAPTSHKAEDDADVDVEVDENGEDTNTTPDLYDNAHEGNEGHVASRAASGYMDYLRHPGSRPGSRGGRSITATNLKTQGHTIGELASRQWDRHEDPDCDMRSPFSVD